MKCKILWITSVGRQCKAEIKNLDLPIVVASWCAHNLISYVCSGNYFNSCGESEEPVTVFAAILIFHDSVRVNTHLGSVIHI